MSTRRSGQSPFVFEHCEDLHTLPASAVSVEAGLHGGFAVDTREGFGQVYYGAAGCGILRVSPDLKAQEVIELPSKFKDVNFHSTKIGEFDGQTRLFLPANENAMVVVLNLDGKVEFTLPRPEFEQYRDSETPFNPTDAVLHGDELLVADGYGANHIVTADLRQRKWTGIFGGRTDDLQVHGKFGTAHGFSTTPAGGHVAIADRPHARIELCTHGGHFHSSHAMPDGSKPCGLNFRQLGGRWYAVVASLDDPTDGRPAPIYITDAETYEVVSTIRPKEELGIELADHIHNAVWHEHNGQLYIVAQAWNPGYYFVLAAVG